jgi:hypothetical protein
LENHKAARRLHRPSANKDHFLSMAR